MVIGIQKGTPDAFGMYQGPVYSIDQPYLDGVSITCGTSRTHIWSYAAGLSENSVNNKALTCPCSRFRGKLPLSFVRDHYYCESGTTGGLSHGTYFTSDPLWDGKGCGSKNACCAQRNLPWFYH